MGSMLVKLWTKLDNWERRVRQSFGMDISTPKARRWSKFHYHFFDHAFLRQVWTNFDEIAPGVYRSNQPTEYHFRRYAKKGITTILNLRGEDRFAHYLFEREICDELGLNLVNVKLWARKLAPRTKMVEVIDTLRSLDKPFLMHCKSGADRTGAVAAMYLMIFEGKPVEEAMKQLSIRYIHLDFTKTGCQDYMLEVYKARNEHAPIGFEEWIRTEYLSKKLQAAFDNRVPPKEAALSLI